MEKPRRVLIYGFGPYREFGDNITAKILKSLPPRPGLKKVVFPVRFHRRQFVDGIERFEPDIVLGLGQSSRRRIEIESQAANRRCSRLGGPPRRISLRSPTRLRTTLQLKIGRQAGKSSNAGDYVCNFSMYVILDHIRRNGSDIHYGFIHIPHDHDLKKASGLVEKIVRRLSATNRKS